MLETLKIKNNDAEAVISVFGAQVISWKKAERNIFFENSKVLTDRSKALRIGAPICFPWFNKGISFAPELKPSHGPVRIKDWEIKSKTESACTFSCHADSCDGLPLLIEVGYSIETGSLKTSFDITNLSENANRFELALHTYFASSAPEKTQITGISDSKIPFIPHIPIDQIFLNHSDKLSLKLTGRTINIVNENFSKSVVWHPGLNHGIADLEDSKKLAPFICMESLTDIVNLGGNEKWQGAVTYTL